MGSPRVQVWQHQRGGVRQCQTMVQNGERPLLCSIFMYMPTLQPLVTASGWVFLGFDGLQLSNSS